jgi:hypothetical protein
MWPFKRDLPIDALNADDEMWSVMEASTGNDLMLVRVNTTARRWIKHPALGVRVGFAIPLNHPDSHGEAASLENFALNQMEDKILSYLKSSGPAIHVLTITTATFKEFVFYTQNGDSLGTIHERIKTETPSHDVQYMAAHDPKWTVYSSFLQ